MASRTWEESSGQTLARKSIVLSEAASRFSGGRPPFLPPAIRGNTEAWLGTESVSTTPRVSALVLAGGSVVVASDRLSVSIDDTGRQFVPPKRSAGAAHPEG